MAQRRKKAGGDDPGDPANDPAGPSKGADRPDLDPAWVARIRENLLRWYASAGRKLPWREDRDPYRVLVSEVMLVQTTVAAVLPYHDRFLRQFPTVRDLADAPEDDVLKAWEGLGYYRRARLLQAAARQVCDRHGGVFPRDPEAILALPGVGRYIAGAVRSFAFDDAAPIVEANTQRVLARWLACVDDIKAPSTQSRFWEAAGRVVPDVDPGAFNSAFMDLGATVCIPRAPLCLTCPVAGDCQARRLGLQDRIPVASPKKPPKAVVEACGLVAKDGRVLMVRRAPGRLWERFWEFPTVHVEGADPAARGSGDEEAEGLEAGILRLAGVRARVDPVAASSIKFGVTTHQVTLHAHRGAWVEGEPAPGPGLMEASWVAPGDLGSLVLGSATRRLVDRLLGPGG